MLLSHGGKGEMKSGEGRRSGIVVKCSFRKGGRAVLGPVGEAREESWREIGRVQDWGEWRGKPRGVLERVIGLADTL